MKNTLEPLFFARPRRCLFYIFSELFGTRNQLLVTLTLARETDFSYTWDAKWGNQFSVYLEREIDFRYHVPGIPKIDFASQVYRNLYLGREIDFQYTWDAKYIFGIPETRNQFSVYLEREIDFNTPGTRNLFSVYLDLFASRVNGFRYTWNEKSISIWLGRETDSCLEREIVFSLRNQVSI